LELERERKIDVISLLLSLTVHLLVLSYISLHEVFSGRVYQVVSSVPLSFDTDVDSQLIGLKSVKGSRNGGSELRKPSISRGEVSKQKERRGGNPIVSKRKTGATKSSSNFSYGGSSYYRRVTLLGKGEGNSLLKLSADILEGSKSNPSIKASSIAPYLIYVRDAIMKNWKVPYYGKRKKGERTTVVLTLRRDGTVDELLIKEISPDITFNRSAVSAIYSVGRFKPFPKGIKQEKIRLKVSFEIK
jgi:protein TonB